jgi:hypothetical protein
LREALLAILRRRLRAAAWPDPGPTVRRLKRDIIALGHAAGKQRDAQRLELLNEVLDRLQIGRRVGAVQTLEAIIADGGNAEALNAWLESCPSADVAPPVVRVLAVLAGDASDAAVSLDPVQRGMPDRQVLDSSPSPSFVEETSSSFSS